MWRICWCFIFRMVAVYWILLNLLNLFLKIVESSLWLCCWMIVRTFRRRLEQCSGLSVLRVTSTLKIVTNVWGRRNQPLTKIGQLTDFQSCRQTSSCFANEINKRGQFRFHCQIQATRAPREMAQVFRLSTPNAVLCKVKFIASTVFAGAAMMHHFSCCPPLIPSVFFPR